MEDDFDVSAAVDEIGGGLGFEVETPAGKDDDVELEVTAPAAETPAVTTETPATEGTETATEPPPAATTDEPPRTWRKEASAAWAALPSEVKAEVLKREADIFQGIERYKADAQVGQQFKTVAAPYSEMLRSANVTPEQAAEKLFATHYQLGTGTPQQKAELLTRMAKSYGIDLVPANSAPAGEAPYIDPAVAALQNELRGVQSQLAEANQRRAAEMRSGVASEVDAFAKDPANPYFDEVSAEVASLLQKGLAGSLKEAYDKAIWLNPTTRAKEAARVAAENSAKAAKEAAEQVAKAKKASGANVKTSAKSGSVTTPLGSLDDTLEATLAKIKAR